MSRGRKPLVRTESVMDEADIIDNVINNEIINNDIIVTENKTYRVVLMGHWCNYRPNTVLNVDEKTYLELKQAGIIYKE